MFRNMATNGTDRRRSARLASRYLQSTPEDDKYEFLCKLITYFKHYTKNSTSTDVTKCIRNSLRHFSSEPRNKPQARMRVDAVFAILEIFRAIDSDVIQNSLEELFLNVLHDCGMLRINLNPPPFSRRSPLSDIHYEVVPGLMKKFSIDSFFYQPFNLMNSCSATEQLLRYGLRFGMEKDDAYHYLDSQFKYLVRRKQFAEFTDEEEEEMVALLKERYKTYGDQRRLYFVLLAIFMVVLKEIEAYALCDYYTKNLKLLFKSIPDSLIAIAEISRFFETIFNGKMEKSRIEHFCNIFLEEFPRSDQPLQPRSLQHLCRFQVRECLTQSRKLPHGVWNLYIPNRLRNYILMQKTEDEFHNHFVKFLKSKDEAFDHPIHKRRRTV